MWGMGGVGGWGGSKELVVVVKTVLVDPFLVGSGEFTTHFRLPILVRSGMFTSSVSDLRPQTTHNKSTLANQKFGGNQPCFRWKFEGSGSGSHLFGKPV